MIGIIGYYFIKLISLFPSRVLYFFSDVLTLIARFFIRYRFRVVIKNVSASFPEMNQKEIRKTSVEFYHHFSDYLVESIKVLSGNGSYYQNKIEYINLDIMEKYYAKKKNILFLCGHVFNWELLNTFAFKTHYTTSAVYKPIKNEFVDQKFRILRSVYKTELVTIDQTFRKMVQSKKKGNSIFFMVADQSPHYSRIQYELDFLNQKTPVFIGFDNIARKLDLIVLYFEVIKKRRGRYQVEIKEISKSGGKEKPYAITHRFFKLLEKTIRKNPSNWLWSHRRWKYKSGTHYTISQKKAS